MKIKLGLGSGPYIKNLTTKKGEKVPESEIGDRSQVFIEGRFIYALGSMQCAMQDVKCEELIPTQTFYSAEEKKKYEILMQKILAR